MREYDPNQPLFSIHIPKCGGSSVSKVLQGWFGSGFKRHYHNERWNRPPIRRRLRRWLQPGRYRPGLCIHGHFNRARGNGVEDYYPDAEQMITFIRDPFELHLSTYHYVLKTANERRGKAFRKGRLHPIIENDWSLEEFLRADCESRLLNFLPAELSLANFREILDQRFILVGLTERLQESMDVLAERLGFDRVAVPHANISPRREPVPDGAREFFAERNPLEMAVFEHVSASWRSPR